MMVGPAPLKYSNGRALTFFERTTWSCAVGFVVLLEILGLLSILLGPSRFELSVSRLAMRIEWSVFRYTKLGPLSGASTDGPADGSALQAVIDRVKSGDISGAQTLFAPGAAINTRVNGHTLLSVEGNAIPYWLKTVGSVLTINADHVAGRSGDVVETALVTTGQLQSMDIATAQAVYQLTVHNGKIVSIVVTFTPDSGIQIGEANPSLAAVPVSRPGFGFAMIVAAGVLPFGLLAAAPSRWRFRLALILVGAPFLAGALAVIATLDDPQYGAIGRIIPGTFLYAIHAFLGAVLNRLDGSPLAAAVQWVKAASHARSPADINRAAQGIATALRRSGNNQDVHVMVCALFDHGSPSVQTAVVRAGIHCS